MISSPVMNIVVVIAYFFYALRCGSQATPHLRFAAVYDISMCKRITELDAEYSFHAAMQNPLFFSCFKRIFTEKSLRKTTQMWGRNNEEMTGDE